MLHRASMKYYADYLQRKGFDTDYLDWQQSKPLSAVFEKLKTQNVEAVHYTDATDYLLERRLSRYCIRYNIKAVRYENPNFIFSTSFISDYFNYKQRYFQTDFYIHARKSLNILLKQGKPVGGRWTLDADNRKPLPKKLHIPQLHKPPLNDYIKHAADYVEKTFPDNPGKTNDFCYAVTFQDAERYLEDFLKNRLHSFGPYQDAIHPQQAFLFHSVLSPALNIGLLQPDYVLERVLEYAFARHIPLNSLEGFVRQLIGWREFIRAVYQREGVKQRTANFFGHSQTMPKAFYQASSGILPVDTTISRVVDNAYAHHIERLMVLGNFMLLCEIHPDEVYRWFMELFIDAYDWVMVPNVYGMSQFADGGLMSTKPYISGSNYILKMSGYTKGSWAAVWDGLYWRFLDINREQFAGNPRMRMMLELSRKMPKDKKKNLLTVAEKFLEKLYE